ncbi:hypothetical protein DICVIV_10557 [Dictyocaulus viviparus]|uniref:Uncharacterized protein n=1 Tax=Dictyocaulus viviparus TaxID=29172 RepID=A0A0D8XFR5_DICVI|nr:hypothetical protein DICVIV_10557 [Dictyocaulus viviparus]
MGGFKVTERDFTMDEVKKALNENRVYEMFGSGTAVVVVPINRILYAIDGREEVLSFPTTDGNRSLMQRFFNLLQDIQFGRLKRPEWTVEV